jgi:hypothetical protein
MPAPGETPQDTPDDIWEACVAYADTVFEVHDQVSWQRDRRFSAYVGWRMTAPAADRLSRSLLALRWYAPSHDAAMTTGRPLTRDDLVGTPLADVVAQQGRRYYELFAGAHTLRPDAVRSHDLAFLELLSYEQAGGVVIAARLDAAGQSAVVRLITRYDNPGLTVRDLAGGRPGGTRS